MLVNNADALRLTLSSDTVGTGSSHGSTSADKHNRDERTQHAGRSLNYADPSDRLNSLARTKYARAGSPFEGSRGWVMAAGHACEVWIVVVRRNLRDWM